MSYRSVKVELLVDLTRYCDGLVAGSEGFTVGTSRMGDRFVLVKFPGLTTLDVLWQSLEITDKERLAEIEEYEKKKEESLKKATEVLLLVGPRGGYKSLSYRATLDGLSSSTSQGDPKQISKLLDFFRLHGVEVKTESQERYYKRQGWDWRY